MEGKIFGVGLNKTGTTTLGHALKILGFRAFHHESMFYPARRVEILSRRAIGEGREPFTYLPALRRFDGYVDIRVVEDHFDYFDRHFPGSRFILTTRDMDSWLESRSKHVERNGRDGGKAWQQVDRDAWERLWHDQHHRVREYFAQRPGDLLEFDITSGDGWAKLAPFLGRPVPAEPFPRLNVEGSGGRSPGQRSRPDRLVRSIGRRFRRAVWATRVPRST